MGQFTRDIGGAGSQCDYRHVLRHVRGMDPSGLTQFTGSHHGTLCYVSRTPARACMTQVTAAVTGTLWLTHVTIMSVLRLIQFTDPHLYGSETETLRGIATLPALKAALADAQQLLAVAA